MTIKQKIGWWLPLGASVIILSALIYGAVQQNIRMSANDPQIQIAEDLAAAFEADVPVPQQPAQIDIAKSLSSYIIIYDENGKVVQGSGMLDGKTPGLPPGVLDYAKAHGEDRVTWQPKAGVRQAAVVIHYGGAHPGFVLAGRNLREVERRESQLTLEVALGSITALIVSLGGTLLFL
jgi:hypothetical protein